MVNLSKVHVLYCDLKPLSTKEVSCKRVLAHCQENLAKCWVVGGGGVACDGIASTVSSNTCSSNKFMLEKFQ